MTKEPRIYNGEMIVSLKFFLKLLIDLLFFIFLERACEWGRGAVGERESQAGSMFSTEPDSGLDPTILR